MGRVFSHKIWIVAAAVVLVLGLAAVIGIGGCAGGEGAFESVTTTYAATATTAAAMAEESRDGVTGAPTNDGSYAPVQVAASGSGTDLTALKMESGQKIITDAQVEIEVESGKFQSAFTQALLIADRYGGYIVSSSSQAGGDEDSLKSGVIAIRIPSTSFDNALADAANIGDIKNRQVQTQDVTGEYVDLEARITNSKAHVQAVLALMAKAKTVDEILQVQQVLTAAQQELEQLQGRQRYLDEHTDYSTLTMTIYEAGAVVTPPSQWGITTAMKDGLHNLVNAFNTVIRGLGVLIPVLVILAIIGYVGYRVWRSAARRRHEREAARYQPYPEGWTGPTGPSAGTGAASPGRENSNSDG